MFVTLEGIYMMVEAMRLLLRLFCEELNLMKEARDGW